LPFSSLSRFPFSAAMPKLSCAQLRDYLVLRHNHISSCSGFVLTMLCTLMIRIRRYLFTYFTWKTLSNYVFEDLRKPKPPNNSHRNIYKETFQMLGESIYRTHTNFIEYRVYILQIYLIQHIGHNGAILLQYKGN
jgi:hypothetical protein